MTKIILTTVQVVMAALALSTAKPAGIYDRLSDAQRASIENGEQVVVLEDSGGVWPKIFLYSRVDATPEQATAVFSDYEFQSSYIPNLKKSQISKRIDKATSQVDYTLSVPRPLSDQHYTVEDKISGYDNGAGYQVDWHLIRADSTKATVGFVRFEPLGNHTIMEYYNFVTPSTIFARWIRGAALARMKDTGRALVTQIEKESKAGGDLLSHQIHSLRDSVAEYDSSK